ncbi:fucose isomerase [Vagococcus sp. BWB3-3]|uniref:Fucose isomerase n=1 Tax=Vagococcus allomyrinae TaxID=2794353 RepID=A0A940PB08_9ENTE|nr:RbsD/FucU domain-containing protein [Vagococcus allomyrinae]MBP1039383.1 fucose isomerase [Vagococcus allomyrinae]
MLKQIPKVLSPELVKVLMEMGHGDELVIADGNYPAAANAQLLVRQDGLGVPELLSAILTLLPIDTYVSSGIALMSVVEGDAEPAIWEEFKTIFSQQSVENDSLEFLERSAFYERGKQAYAILATGEEAIYANIILRKGVVK